ncbi:MAG: hypothetical protein KH354_07810 [Clostridiales bacterium]|nr:hypothetical protein [Clostridiales bacterium]
MKAGKTISIAFGFIGAVVGAGMASGAEVAAYFTPLGSWAIPAILVSAAFMAGFFYLLMRFSAQQGFSGIGELCRCLYPSAGGVLQYAIYLGGVTVGAAMLSASGELISAFAGWPNFCGALLMLALSCAVVACGARGVERVSAILMPTVVLFFVLLLLFFPAFGAVVSKRGVAEADEAFRCTGMGQHIRRYCGGAFDLSRRLGSYSFAAANA